MKRFVYLYGDLARRYGSSFHLRANTTIDVIRLLQANFGDFYSTIRRGQYQLIRGGLRDGESIEADMLSMTLGSSVPLHIVPVIEGGAGGEKKAVISAVAGVAMIAAAVVLSGGLAAGGISGLGKAMASTAFTMPMGLGCVTYGQIALLGGILTLGGIAQLLAPSPKVGNYSEREDKKTSYIFSGAVNRMEEGGPVPVIYGKDVFVGSTTISVGMRIEEEIDDDSEHTYHFIVCDAGVGATVDPLGTVTLMDGQNLTVSCGAADGFELKDVVVDDKSKGPLTQYSFTNVQANHSIHVVAEPLEE